MKLAIVLIALTVSGGVAGTLALAGAQLILEGQQLISDANTEAAAGNAQWAHYCQENGSQTTGCNGTPPFGPGIDQPQGQQGARETRLGQGILQGDLVPVAVTGILAFLLVWILRKPATKQRFGRFDRRR